MPTRAILCFSNEILDFLRSATIVGTDFAFALTLRVKVYSCICSFAHTLNI